MIFSSVLFVLYFLPIFLALYYFANTKFRNYVALVGSVIFYVWGNPSFFPILAVSIFWDYILSHAMFFSKNRRVQTLFMIISVVSNLGLLFYYKYLNFAATNLYLLLNYFGINAFSDPYNIILPIGISFFVFHKISYIVDLYKYNQQPLKSFWDYMLYILLFPQLVAGPIVRFREISDQLINRVESSERFIQGTFLFFVGLSKKVLLANPIGNIVDTQLGQLSNLSTLDFFVVMIGYSFQIYLDFSGYSDMALGLGKMIGFEFPKNFNFPYTAQNITEFWRKWHITLSNWMRDYLYIPLGGNQKGVRRTYINLIVVFLLSGVWHGASWNFVFWGLYHGFFLILDRLFLIKFTSKFPKAVQVGFSFIIVTIGWCLFRLEKTSDLMLALDKVGELSFSFKSITPEPYLFHLLIIASIYCFGGQYLKQKFSSLQLFQNPILLLSISFALSVLCIGTLLLSSYNPFIYFRF